MNLNVNQMTAPLARVMVCPPEHAGWNDGARAGEWQGLTYMHPLNFEVAAQQHAALVAELERAGAELVVMPASADPNVELSIDAAYVHDSSLTTNWGAIILHTGKANRQVEGPLVRRFYESIGYPVLGEVSAPGLAESGDMLWVDERTLLVGRGFRTNGAGIAQLRALLEPKGVEVIASGLPYGNGPAYCLHLLSNMSPLDASTLLVDLPMIPVETVELLHERGWKLLEIDASERETLACNVLALGEGRLLAIAENEKTNARLRAAGFDVRTFAGSEICINGGGGPTCLTRVLVRGQVG